MPTTRNYAQNQMKPIYYTWVFCLFIDDYWHFQQLCSYF